jgi:hypothetical protein
VTLFDGQGNIVRTTTTDASGLYIFTNVPTGDYQVGFGQPTGFTASRFNQGFNDSLDSDFDPNTGRTPLFNLAVGETDLSLDAGFFRPGTIGDFVFDDIDADGIQDAGESGISGATVTLLDGQGNIIRTTTTNGVGFYQFTNLTPGDYVVEFTTPNGFVSSPQDQGGNDVTDSDANPGNGRTNIISLASGETNNTIDAGFFQSTATIGDFVFNDLDADGVFRILAKRVYPMYSSHYTMVLLRASLL